MSIDIISASVPGLRGPGLDTDDAATVAAAIAAAQAINAAVRNPPLTFQTLQDRGNYTYLPGGAINPALAYGQDCWCGDQARYYKWTKAGASDGVGGLLTADNWVGIDTEADTLNKALTAAAGADAKIINPMLLLSALKIQGLTATALSSGTVNVPFEARWGFRGSDYLLAQNLYWQGATGNIFTVPVDAKRTAFSWQDWTKPVGVISPGDSFFDSLRGTGSISTKVAAALGVPLYNPSLISGDSKQAYRVGAVPLYLTVAGNALPAGDGTVSVAITAINGAAPSAANPASFLLTFDGDTATIGNTLTGVLAGVHGTARTTANGAYNYSFIPDAGSPAVSVPAGSVFVPDFAAQMRTCDILISAPENDWYTGNLSTTPGVPDHVNPVMLARIDAIVRANYGQRIQLLGLLPDASWIPGTPQYTALRACNAYLKTLYPNYYVVDASGKDPLATVLAFAPLTQPDSTDIANGVTPTSLRRLNAGNVRDTLHLDPAAGDQLIANLVIAHRAIQVVPSGATIGVTRIMVSAAGQNGYDGTVLSDQSVAVVQLGATASILGVNTDTRYVFGKQVAAARAGAGFAMGDAITADGYHYAKYSIRGLRGMTFARAADGFWEMSNPVPVVTSVSFDDGSTVDSTSLRYAYGKPLLWGAAVRAGRSA